MVYYEHVFVYCNAFIFTISFLTISFLFLRFFTSWSLFCFSFKHILNCLPGWFKANKITRISHQKCCLKKAALKNFAIFKGNTIVGVSFNKVLGLKAWNFVKEKTLPQVFSSEYCLTFKNTYFESVKSCIWRGGNDILLMRFWSFATYWDVLGFSLFFPVGFLLEFFC